MLPCQAQKGRLANQRQSAVCCGACLEELVQQEPVVLLALKAVHIAVAVELDVGREVAGQQFCHKEPICKISAGRPAGSASGSSDNERWHMHTVWDA